MQASAVSADEKRRALQEVLQSTTLRRAEQLRQFLQYVVEEELAGRGGQISESDVAVHGLHRPATYSPETDSIVRTRAHALRQRLAEYYSVEAPHSEIRIELPKGGYTPRFVRAGDIAPPVAPVPSVIAPPPPETAPSPPSRGKGYWPVLMAVFSLGVIVASGGAWLLYRSSTTAMPSELADAWAPVLDSRTPVKIVMSSPFQLWVRDYRAHPPPLVDPVETPPLPEVPSLIRSYAEQFPLAPDSKLYVHTNSAGALWGDAAGVQVATHFLTSHGIRTEFVPEKSLKSGYVLRNDSYVVFGRSEYSPLMRNKLPDAGFDVIYLPAIRRHGIALRSKRENGPMFLPTPGTHGQNYGLVTIFREAADDGHITQAMMFSGVISNGAQAAIEFMTTPRHVKTLTDKLRAEGLTSWPRVLQVVVRTETSEFYPVRTEYLTHLVLQR